MQGREKDGGEASNEGREPPGVQARRPERDKEASRPDAAPGKTPAEPPPAGPHAKPGLTNPQATPGSGLLPDPEEPGDAIDSASS